MVLRLSILVAVLMAGLFHGPALSGVADPVSAIGEQRILVLPVRFPGTNPTRSIEQIRIKVDKVDKYLRAASYGKLWLTPTVTGWYDMPAPLNEYKVSPHNYDVDRNRVRRLLADSLGAVQHDVKLDSFDQVWIVVGAETRWGSGYGMIAYCANPGMLSGVNRTAVRLEEVTLNGGGRFAGPTVVSAENAHPGHVAHDLLHAFGGIKAGNRAVVDLYDFDLQSRHQKPDARFTPAEFAIHVGPWDIMSEHFVELRKPPPAPSSFTRRQLGWIGGDEVVGLRPGDVRRLTLRPLAEGKGILAVRVDLGDGRALMIENRQPVGLDSVLPAAGMVVMEINARGWEGRDIVRVADANPSTPGFRAAPFRPNEGERRFYINERYGVAVAPLSIADDGGMDVLITTPSDAALPGH
ncbi:MAG: hypothetical protein OQJ99_05570 [Rhodospirillales bacterium]|nr:hypothetical protein [Rhodospirillales bacterium]